MLAINCYEIQYCTYLASLIIRLPSDPVRHGTYRTYRYCTPQKKRTGTVQYVQYVVQGTLTLSQSTGACGVRMRSSSNDTSTIVRLQIYVAPHASQSSLLYVHLLPMAAATSKSIISISLSFLLFGKVSPFQLPCFTITQCNTCCTRSAFLSRGVMGALLSIHNKDLTAEYHPNGNLYRYKGLTYDEDGVTIIDSIFQQIADGDVPPGKPSVASDTPTREERLNDEESREQRDLLFQNEEVAAFYTMDPGCDQGHILVVPRAKSFKEGFFPKSCVDLKPTKKDIELLLQMRYVGEQAMKEHQKIHMAMNKKKIHDEFLYCFHVPPFNSIDHLHLHVFGSAARRNSLKSYIKHPPWFDTPWCVRLETVLSSLERNGLQPM